jgi:hypothetical protein
VPPPFIVTVSVNCPDGVPPSEGGTDPEDFLPHAARSTSRANAGLVEKDDRVARPMFGLLQGFGGLRLSVHST